MSLTQKKPTGSGLRKPKLWPYYEIGFWVLWVGGNLWLQPGSVAFHLGSPRWYIAVVLGGIVLGVLFGYVVKTLYSMQRGAKHRRIMRERAVRQEN